MKRISTTFQEKDSMEIEEFKKKIGEIVSDKAVSLDDRMENALGLSEEISEDENFEDEENESARKEKYECEYIAYDAIIGMLKREVTDHSHDLTLMQLYTLMAENISEMGSYRRMKAVAEDVLTLMRDELTPAEIYQETIPRLASALGESAYNHALYEILLRYVRCVLKETPDDKNIKPQAAKLLKLHILMREPYYCAYLWSKELQDTIAGLFRPEELIKIIIEPKIGRLRRDPVEYTSEWEEICYDVEDRIDERFANAPRQRGLCFRIWSAKRDILKEEYGIDWRSPAQMNPRVRFD